VDFTDASFYDILASRGLEVKHASRRLEVVPTPQDIASELKISPFEPAIFISSCGRMESKVPVEYTESYYPAGSSSFLIEIHR
ncbi:MAG TPA: UTRA domain-containing protein, partial [Firmicutes bacterium]|nr:UTRA domain-containing protein [Bacillota bacterium]